MTKVKLEALQGELIDDRSLESADQDRFRHGDFVEELAALINSVRTPSNIALFGAWGSGKTGLVNLLRQRLEGVKGIRVAVFDAFKYAETPLRRHFLSQVAKDLDVGGKEFARDLYRSSVSNKVKIPPVDLAKLLLVFLLALIAVESLIAFAVLITSAVSNESVESVLNDFFAAGLILAFAPASLLTIFVGLAGRVLTFQRTASAPSSEEEFEELFRTLVDKSGAKRLVILIDELDRCSSTEVVSTLETIKTFLDVRKCVFVVAADQQVLEEALTKSARESTPVDPANPYYSAGSAYIDKIFQYQISLPPLMARRLSGFALDLVRGLSGLWSEIDREAVVSVLIPDHVSSPRRVKTLLNGFVMAYRLAHRRAEEGRIAEGVSDRAPELAKLVCLRQEFPLFANDLAVDWRLSTFVRQLADDPKMKLPDHVPPSVQERARLYADAVLPVDEILAEDPQVNSIEPAESTERRLTGQVQKAQGEQLITYLQKTSFIEGPHKDLIHLESPGAVFDLDPAVADLLDEYATSGRDEAAIEIVNSLTREDQQNAIRLLAQRTKEASIGIESGNAATALLRVFGSREDEVVDEVADRVAEAIDHVQTRFALRAEHCKGAYLVGIRSSRAVGTNLLKGVLEREEVITEPDLGLLILRTGDAVPADQNDRLSAIFVSRLLDDETAHEAASALIGLQDELAIQIFRGARESLFAAVESEIPEDA